MKRLLYILPLLLASLAEASWGTITLVQKSANAASSGSPFTTTLSNTAAGNAIVVVVNSRSASGTAVSDGINTYSSTSQCANGGNQVQSKIEQRFDRDVVPRQEQEVRDHMLDQRLSQMQRSLDAIQQELQKQRKSF